MKVGDKVDEFVEVFYGASCQSQAVVNEATEKVRLNALVLGEDLFLNKAHKETGIAGAHPGAHCHSAALAEMTVVELEGVEGEDQFCETEESGDRKSSSVFVQKMFEGQKTF